MPSSLISHWTTEFQTPVVFGLYQMVRRRMALCRELHRVLLRMVLCIRFVWSFDFNLKRHVERPAIAGLFVGPQLVEQAVLPLQQPNLHFRQSFRRARQHQDIADLNAHLRPQISFAHAFAAQGRELHIDLIQP